MHVGLLNLHNINIHKQRNNIHDARNINSYVCLCETVTSLRENGYHDDVI